MIDKEAKEELRNFETELYLMATIGALVNRNYLTDLGDYEMECEFQLADRSKIGLNIQDASLVILIRIRNLITGELEYANAFYKIITRNKTFDKGNADEVIDGIFDGSKKDKLAFILRNETRVFKKMYVKSFYVNEWPFLEKFKKFDDYGSPYINIGGKPSPELLKAVDEHFLEIIEEEVSEIKAAKAL